MGHLELASRKDSKNILYSESLAAPNDDGEILIPYQVGESLAIELSAEEAIGKQICDRKIPGVNTYDHIYPAETPRKYSIEIETQIIQKKHNVGPDWMSTGTGLRAFWGSITVQAETDEGESVLLWILTGLLPTWLQDMPYPLVSKDELPAG